jgi:WD40 repeat protein/energy-coupling factor transporter ATP-binding protein EcfA2
MADKKNLPNPFPGLRPFQSDEEHLFFGRENQTLELLKILRDNRFVGVIGTSGSGKSSLVRCGLLSELYGGSFLKAGTDWEVAVMNPGGGPFNQLSKSLVDADIYDSEEPDIHLKLNATLRRSRLGLVETIRQATLPEGTNFLLVVDQFEEIFRYSEAGEEQEETADDFISMILEAAKQSNIPIYVIITMRSDYIGDCSKFEGLPEEINEGEYLIPRLSREEYKSVIEGPVRVGGAKLAPRLLQRLLNDIGTESDQLPCLQHALMRTWDAWADREDAEELDLEDYRAIGGMSKALSIHADEIFDTFDNKATRETATRMFRAITEKGDDNRGIRRPLRLQQLAEITNHSIEEVKSVVDPYRQQGVTFLMPPSDRELEADTVIDISHESLMRVWQRLRNWVEEEAQSARIYRRLVDTSSLWKNEEAGLYHDPDLQISQSWRDKYQPNEAWADLYGGGFEFATEFLEASEEEGRKAEREKELARQKELEQAQELAEARERSAKNMKRFAAVVGFVAIIALGAMVFAVKAQKLAEKSQAEADEARKSAELAEENVRMEFARSDNSLGNSLSSSNTELALAHFSRSLEVEPNNPHAVDRSFNILAYQKPPKSQFADLDLKSNIFIASAANANGTLIATSVRGSNKNVSIWDPLKKNPLIEIPMSNGMNFWYGGLDLNKQGDLLAIGYNQGNDSKILKINEDGSYETETFLLRSHIGSVKFSGDGSRVLTNSWKHKVTEIWDIKTAEPTFSITSGSWYPTWSPDEKSILMGRHEAKVAAIVEIKSGDTKLFKHDEIIWHKAVYDQSGRKILTFGKPAPTETTQNFYVWDISTQQIEAILTHDNKEIAETIRRHNFENDDGTGLGLSYCVGCFSPDSQIVVTTATDQNLKLWSAKNGQLLDSVKIPKLPARDQNPEFSNDGKRMMIPLRDGTFYILNFINNYSELPPLSDSVSLSKAYNFIKHESKLRGITYPLPEVISAHLNGNCNLLLLGSKNGIAALFDTSSGEQVDSSFSHHGEIHEIAKNLRLLQILEP